MNLSRVAADGSPDRAQRLQASLRGRDAERQSSTGLSADRTRSSASPRRRPHSFCMTLRRRSGRTCRRDNSKSLGSGSNFLWERVSHYTMKDLIPTERIEQAIFLIRGQKVLLDADLALIYGVPTKVLNQAVKRNLRRVSSGFFFFFTAQGIQAIPSPNSARAEPAP